VPAPARYEHILCFQNALGLNIGILFFAMIIVVRGIALGALTLRASMKK
jgi:hypothetical protein